MWDLPESTEIQNLTRDIFFTNMEERIVRLYSQIPFLLETVLKERGA
jgi:hypothetical protein